MKLSRRTTLKTTALAALSAFTSRAHAHAPSYTPALVIGSGFGGAVAALRLGEAGIPTLVLERGKRWPIRADGDTFATFERPDGRAAYLSERSPAHLVESPLGLPAAKLPRFAGVWEHVQGEGIDVVVGAAVGGGSISYNAITVEPRREDFERAFAGLVDYDEMHTRYYPRARSVIKPARVPHDLLDSEPYRSTRVQEAAARAAGLTLRDVELAVDWEIVREELRGQRRASAIAGQSWYGLNSGAKRSVDRNYLRRAEATGAVDVLPLHEVTGLQELPRLGLYAVDARELDEHGTTLRTKRIFCRYLFLAAGSIGTSRLLVRARDSGKLPRLSTEVGRGIGGNGDVIVVRAGETPTTPGTGGPAGHFLAEDRSTPGQPVTIVEVATPSHLASHPGVSSYVAMGVQPALGELRYQPASGEVTLHWPAADDPRFAPARAAMDQLLHKLDQAAGTATVMRNDALTAHPLGGVSLGRACDGYGRVHGYQRLYVVDGALIPGSAGVVNPSLTIAALAERCLEHILRHDT